MKQFFYLLCLCAFAFAPITAKGVVGCQAAACGTETDTRSPYISLEEGCQTGRCSLYGGYIVMGCVACRSGFTLVNRTATIPGCTNTITYSGCDEDGGTGGGDMCLPNSENMCVGTAPASLSNCKTSNVVCFGNTKIRTCTECNTGYKLADDSVTVPGCANEYTRKKCSKNSIGGSECEGKLCLPGYTLNKFTCECVRNLDASSCKDGWYFLSSFLGCMACPGNDSTDSGVMGELELRTANCGVGSDSGTSVITGCFYRAQEASHQLHVDPTTCEYSDDVGTFTYTSDCYYTQN